MGKPKKWKRGKPKSGRAGCLMCKPHKRQGVDDPVRSEILAQIDEEEQLSELKGGVVSFIEKVELEQLSEMSNKQLEAEIGNHIYSAALIFERLEHAGCVAGNGHHMAQELSKCAVEMFKERKRDK